MNTLHTEIDLLRKEMDKLRKEVQCKNMMIENERTQRTRLEGELTSRKQEVQKLKAFIQLSNTEKSESANATSGSGSVASANTETPAPRHVRTNVVKKPDVMTLDLPVEQDENSLVAANAQPKQDATATLVKEDAMNVDLDFGNAAGNPGGLKMNAKRRLRRDNMQQASGSSQSQGQGPSAGDCNQQ
jgi:hypothetical protein